MQMHPRRRHALAIALIVLSLASVAAAAPAMPSGLGQVTATPQALLAPVLPPLTAPTGVRVSAMSVAPTRLALAATFEATLPATDLEAQLADQLQVAGWGRAAGGADGPLAWSSWTVPGEGAWQGALLVLEWAGLNQRSVYLQMASPTSPPGPLLPAQGFAPRYGEPPPTGPIPAGPFPQAPGAPSIMPPPTGFPSPLTAPPTREPIRDRPTMPGPGLDPPPTRPRS